MHIVNRAFKQLFVFLFVRKLFYPLHLIVYKISMWGLGIRNHENERVSGERAFIRYLKRKGMLASGVIFDIGANVGNYSEMLRRYDIHLPIFAFEPHPVAYQKLKISAGKNDFIPVKMAAGEEETNTVIYDYSGAGGSEHASMYREVIETLHDGVAEEVAITQTTLDDFVYSREIREIALLKIDTEGHELPVLKGARQCIAAGMVKVIQIEFNEMNVISRTFFKDIIDLLPGYHFYRLLPDGLQPLGKYNPAHYEIFSFQNIVAIKAPAKSFVQNVP
ncbi:FkbM family methyltransferase [Chitinophaga qingshengii]|uniref:FkbM family methyltransferase n=1 Tax=Chitinophaga qingshengii TaxID=1569794 RepID=A0ABR7TGB3_9BACT|nr:FkbM family methyltransferase [Chitinophaga qingshengii]MBC9929419.1 FkbM family methyltransferase [Chitinophaga qingshengii]